MGLGGHPKGSGVSASPPTMGLMGKGGAGGTPKGSGGHSKGLGGHPKGSRGLPPPAKSGLMDLGGHPKGLRGHPKGSGVSPPPTKTGLMDGGAAGAPEGFRGPSPPQNQAHGYGGAWGGTRRVQGGVRGRGVPPRQRVPVPTPCSAAGGDQRPAGGSPPQQGSRIRPPHPAARPPPHRAGSGRAGRGWPGRGRCRGRPPPRAAPPAGAGTPAPGAARPSP